MPQRLVVFVHGMGAFTDGWSATPDGPRTKLVQMADKYAEVTANGSFAGQVSFGEITYDPCFAKLVDQWNADADALDAWAKSSGRAMPNVVSWLKNQAPSDTAAKNFFWTTAIDPLLYRGFSLVRDEVRETVMSKLVTLIKNVGPQAVELTIVAHSLGTAVMHDVLQLLGTGQAPPSVGDVSMLQPPNFVIGSVIMIADVCRLGPAWVHDIEYFGSICRPVGGA